jgi:flagellar hook-associated protein 3 FlgL
MRITQNSIFVSFETALNGIQERRNNEEIKLSTGQDIINISDDPKRVRDIKTLSNTIDRTSQIQDNVQQTIDELASVSTTLDSMTTTVGNIRQAAIDSTQAGASTSLATLATNVKGLLEDLINGANSQYNGKYMFSGTQTTPGSIQPTLPEKDNNPFELITVAPTAANPSGLQVVFKGNMDDRVIHKDASSTEVINTKANDLFGTNGEDLFKPIIDLYNLMAYKNGVPRQDNQGYTTDELNQLSNFQKSIADLYTNMTSAGAKNGAKMNRLQAIHDQMTEEITRLQDFKSSKEDTDVAQSSINLKKEDTALQYTLQVGAQLLPNTLFDYLK